MNPLETRLGCHDDYSCWKPLVVIMDSYQRDAEVSDIYINSTDCERTIICARESTRTHRCDRGRAREKDAVRGERIGG